MYFNPQDDNEDEEEIHSFGGRDGVIFLIDCSESMFDENESKLAKFRTCINCVECVMMNSIICGEKDLLGVVFYNTEHSPAPKDESELEPGLVVPTNSAIFMPMNTTSRDTIQYIKNFRESDDFFDFETRFGHSDNANFSDILWLCTRMFTRCGYKLQASTIILFTDKEQPHPSESHEYKQVMIKANDLNKIGVDINLIPMADQFDGDAFYREFLSTIQNESPDTFLLDEPTQNLEKLLNRIYRKDFRKRCNSHLKMTIGNNIVLGVGIYNLSRKTLYPKSVHLLKKTNDIVIAKRATLVQYDNNETVEKRLLPTDQRKTQVIGGEKMSFTVEEVTEMKALMSPGIRLLGFKPKTKISIHQYFRPSLFLYPDELTIKGSTNLFRALWEKCMEKEKIAICVLTVRRKTAPRYVALIPQDDEFDSDGEQIRQNGFRVFYLPCEVHIRNLDVFDKNTIPETTPETVKLCEKIIKKLKFKYKPQQFENPSIKAMYANIEALAYEATEENIIEDTTLPNLQQQDNKIGQFIDEFNEMFGNIELNQKRKIDGKISESRTKVQKLDNDHCTEEEIISSIQSGTAEKYSVNALKAYLQNLGTKGLSKMNKNMLINEIKKHHNL